MLLGRIGVSEEGDVVDQGRKDLVDERGPSVRDDVRKHSVTCTSRRGFRKERDRLNP